MTNYDFLNIPESQEIKIKTDKKIVASGYVSSNTLFASRYQQGERIVYSLDLSPDLIINLLSRPDPDRTSLGNRQIRPQHADAFGKYLRERANWVIPSIMLRTPSTFDFDPQTEVEGIQFGLLTIPRRSIGDLHIVDGQHRILGMFKAADGINADLDRARSSLIAARKNDGEGSMGERDIRKRIAELEVQRLRLEHEFVSVQIIVEADEKAYRQIFFDVSDNALGITASVRTRFDSYKVVNRALPLVMDVHPLLRGRVDHEADRMGRGSVYLMGAKHVGEIIRVVNVGLDGRVSRRQEAEFDEKQMAKRTLDYLDVFTESFPQMQALIVGQLTSDDVRKMSLLGSVLMVRIFGAAFHELTTKHGFTIEMMGEFFRKLAPHMAAPVHSGSIWLNEMPEIFEDGKMSPRSRRQDLKLLTDAILRWALDKPVFLDSAPASE
jgi:DNA-sulfur modification-associated